MKCCVHDYTYVPPRKHIHGSSSSSSNIRLLCWFCSSSVFSGSKYKMVFLSSWRNERSAVFFVMTRVHLSSVLSLSTDAGTRAGCIYLLKAYSLPSTAQGHLRGQPHRVTSGVNCTGSPQGSTAQGHLMAFLTQEQVQVYNVCL